MYPYLDLIQSPSDLGKLNAMQLDGLCRDIRQFLIDKVSATGGHLASNLGIVELTVAIHLEFDTARDRLVFDVGHQCYVHKLLTGRREGFDTLRQFGGMAGFPKPSESVHDACIAGHASNSVSIAAGMARARTTLGQDYHVLALIGDGALSGGMAYEALNDAGRSGEPLIVILNDNGMSISRNVGALAQHLAKIRVKPSYSRAKLRVKHLLSRLPGGQSFIRGIHEFKQRIKNILLPGLFFENMGFLYLGPADGHNIEDIRELLRYAKALKKPVLIHVKTVKGKGYRFSQEHPETFHGTPGFNARTGRSTSPQSFGFSEAFGTELCAIAARDPRIFAITAAMPAGTGLSEFASRYPARFVDVGIAEEHAVATAAGMARQGLIPVCAIYSTFLQRAYDQIIHDVAIDRLHVVFAVDRAGISGEDGETHQGIFDAAFLCGIPGLTVYAPASARELRTALHCAVEQEQGPVAIRYPKKIPAYAGEDSTGQAAVYIRRSDDPRILLIGYGPLLSNLLEAARLLEAQGIACEVLKLFRIRPLPEACIRDAAMRAGAVLIAEESIPEGSVGQRIAAMLVNEPVRVAAVNCASRFLPCGSITRLREACGLDAKSIACSAASLLTENPPESPAL